jgi:hypothetical protein
MKKIFVALMAALVMVSCGGGSDKKADPGQFLDEIISATETILEKSEQAIRADDAEMFVVAFEKFADQAVDIYNRYGDAFDGLSPEEQNKYQGKVNRMMSLLQGFQEIQSQLNQLDASPSQQQRVMKAAQKVQDTGMY